MILDSITKEDIVRGFQVQCNEFDDAVVEIDKKIRMIGDNAQKLKRFVIVKPFEISSQICVGDFIRFIKKKMFKLSCICTVREIVYKSGSNSNVEKLVLSMAKHHNVFVIYSHYHYIYKKDIHIFDQIKKQKLEEMYEKKKNVKMVTIPNAIQIKLSDIYFGKEYGAKLDLKVNKIFENNQKYNENSNKIELENGTYVDNLINKTELRKGTLNKIKRLKDKR